MYIRYVAFVLTALVGSVSFAFYDLQISEYLISHLQPEHLTLAKVITKIGDGTPFIIASVLLVALGEFSVRIAPIHNRLNGCALREYGYFCIKAFIITGVLILALKWGVGRARSDLWFEGQFFGFVHFSFENAYDFKSFPSGHSHTAFTVAFLLTIILPNKAKLPLDLMAGCVAISRVLLSEHWTADIIFGSLIGYLVPAYLYALARGPKFEFLKTPQFRIVQKTAP